VSPQAATGRRPSDQGRPVNAGKARVARASEAAPGASRASAARVAAAATLACALEACAEKVGNVTPTRGFRDARFDDFAVSARALGEAIAGAAPRRVGRTVYQAVAATARVAPSNTNLGMALLFAPLAAAARASEGSGLRRRLARVLRDLSVDDARWAYRAIRLARPGGLGQASRADVAGPPDVTLREAMRLAATRDTVAREYTREFTVTFDLALVGLRRALGRGLGLLDAIAQAHLELMAQVPDTLIARKAGAAAATAVARRARAVVRAGGLLTRNGLAAARRLDADLRRRGNVLNPGTSADLIAAALFVWLLETPAPRRATERA
jgi:triphosphoribosyl-dephospho-CoA synthase